MYIYKTIVRLNHTDAAGILFFGRIYDIIHEAHEALLASLGLGVHSILFDLDFLLPFVHSEADYESPLTVGDEIEIRVKPEKIGNTSLTLVYEIYKNSGVKAATARTVCVSVDKKTFTKIPLPKKLRAGLESIS